MELFLLLIPVVLGSAFFGFDSWGDEDPSPDALPMDSEEAVAHETTPFFWCRWRPNDR